MPPLPNDIINGCLQRDAASQEQMYRLCYAPMIRVCLRYCTDIDQAGAVYNEGMLKVFNNLQQYRGKGDILAWIRKIMLNTCLDHCRRQVRFAYQSTEESTINEIVTIDPEVYGRISGNEIMRLLQELPRNTALVFNLFALEGYKHEEVAQLLGISSGTSKWHVNEARRLLKNKLEVILKKEIYSNAI